MKAPPRRLLRARLQLMLRHPYLSSAVVRLPFCDASEFDWCQTAATDGYHIFYDRSFFEQLSESETLFVFAHELLHVVLGHGDRRGEREPERWNIATDLAINRMLVELEFVAPTGVLLDSTFDGLTAEQIYDRLSGPVEKLLEGLRLGRKGDASLGHRRSRRNDANANHAARRQWTRFDAHLDPADPRLQACADVQPISDQERRAIQRRLVRDIAARRAGSEPGMLEDEILAASKSQVPWQTILSRFITGLRRSDYRLFPFNRKHLWRGLYLPSVGVPGPEHLVIAVDTSGSMGVDDLERVMVELDVLRSQTECVLTVVQFDVKIQRVDRFDAWEPASPGFAPGESPGGRARWRGRGGTDIKAPFEWLERDETTPADAIIVMTDGYGDMPDHAPQIPTLWISMPGSNVEYPFGSVIQLENAS